MASERLEDTKVIIRSRIFIGGDAMQCPKEKGQEEKK